MRIRAKSVCWGNPYRQSSTLAGFALSFGLGRQPQNGFGIAIAGEFEEIRVLVDGALEQPMIVGAADVRAPRLSRCGVVNCASSS